MTIDKTVVLVSDKGLNKRQLFVERVNLLLQVRYEATSIRSKRLEKQLRKHILQLNSISKK